MANTNKLMPQRLLITPLINFLFTGRLSMLMMRSMPRLPEESAVLPMVSAEILSKAEIGDLSKEAHEHWLITFCEHAPSVRGGLQA